MTPLRTAREAAGYRTRPAAVAALVSLAGHRRIKLSATRESVTRAMRGWENGEHEVKSPYLELLCELYGKSADELGLSHTPTQARSDTGLIYSASLDGALQTINSLAQFDTQQHPGVVSGTFSEQAIATACLDWLFGYPTWDVTTNGDKITPDDVAEIVATTQMFDNMDRGRGGDHARKLAVAYLKDNVLPRLQGTYDERVGADLFHASAVLCEVIGYMAYDGEKHSLAQRYFIQALRLAKSADDTAYGAFVLNTMSHQAMYLNRPQQAMRLAQAAMNAYHGHSVPVVGTEAAMLEAKACAMLGDSVGCQRALNIAEDAFNAQGSTTTPNWAAHWSETLFDAFAGDCWLTLGDPVHAQPHLQRAWNGSQSQARRRVFASSQLAKLALLERNVDESAHFALTAVESVDGLRSRRSRQVVSDLRRDLAPHRAVAAVRAFMERTDHLLAARPRTAQSSSRSSCLHGTN